jgi:hypothetical protein
MRSQPRELAKISINIGGQSSFWQAFSKLQSITFVHCSCLVCVKVWRRVDIVATVASIFQFWLGLSLGYGLDYLISSFLVHCPWGKVNYPLFGYLT